MDLQNMDLKGGSLQISTEVIGKIARCAALEIEGVSRSAALTSSLPVWPRRLSRRPEPRNKT